MERTFAIILAGGRGLRLNNRVPKQFLTLGDKPVIVWSLELCDALTEIDAILTVIPDEFIPEAERIARAHNIHKIMRIIPGGSTRQESAYNAITSMHFSDNDTLVFHDAARPFIRPDMMRTCIAEAKLHGGAAVYVPVQDTVAEIKDEFVVSVPLRDRMFYAQTPQAFRFSIISRAHEIALTNGISTTDDVSLVLSIGHKVKMIEGDFSNFKITTDFDYQAACRIAETIHRKKQQ
jgi:2-C-methyl-D-erythritol 4-phosphate cytidylyltransferase